MCANCTISCSLSDVMCLSSQDIGSIEVPFTVQLMRSLRTLLFVLLRLLFVTRQKIRDISFSISIEHKNIHSPWSEYREYIKHIFM